MNIKLVVVDGDALAYIQPESPNNFCTLGSSIKSLHKWGQGPKPLFGCTVRPATRRLGNATRSLIINAYYLEIETRPGE